MDLKISGMYRIFFSMLLAFFCWFGSCIYAQQAVTVSPDATAVEPVSPLFMGRTTTCGQPGSPLSTAQWQRLRDLGIRMFRENGGNNHRTTGDVNYPVIRLV
jgi:hypothetical protein